MPDIKISIIVPVYNSEKYLPETAQSILKQSFSDFELILVDDCATDSSGKTQDAFDYYVTDNGKNYGMKCFYVTADQRIEEDIYEEN